jgi:hypothetical protein
MVEVVKCIDIFQELTVSDASYSSGLAGGVKFPGDGVGGDIKGVVVR